MAPWLSALGRSPVRRAWSLPRRRRPSTDPFVTLEVQLALARLDREISRLLCPDEVLFARAHHVSAAVAAYGQVLDEACALAGISLAEDGPAVRRVLAEAELRSRGWDW